MAPDQVALIIQALSAGASYVVLQSATEEIKISYRAFRDRVKQMLGGDAAEPALQQLSENPGVGENPLRSMLAAHGAAADTELMQAAEALLRQLPSQRGGAPRVHVTIGDHAKGPTVAERIETHIQNFND